MKRFLWNSLTSLRLTVICLAISVVLVFIGTVAQVEEGLYEAQARYFKQWLVWGPLLFGYRLPIVLPGGYFLGTLLVINLVCAHIKRFQWSRRKWGLHLAHFGIVVLLVGQLGTDMLSRETHLRLREGESSNYTVKHRDHELVFSSDAGSEADELVAVPESRIASQQKISHPDLPFDLRVKDYQVNSEIFSRTAIREAAGELTTALAAVEARYSSPESLLEEAERALESRGRVDVWRAALSAVGEQDVEDPVAAVAGMEAETKERLAAELSARFREQMLAAFAREGGARRLCAERLARGEPVDAEAWTAEADQGAGPRVAAVPLPEARDLDGVNFPYATVELASDEESLGTWLFSPWLDVQEIRVGEKKWRAVFRSERVYHPFEVKLLETTHEVYRGTDIPRNFQSRIMIENELKGETREVDISMNHPLRYEGLTFFQYQMGRDEANANVGTSVLLVVKNPTWLTPYIGCILVALGLSYHFMLHLLAFIARRRSVTGGPSASPTLRPGLESRRP